jgi:bacillithiol biosynthesis deacetylase BshB1
MKLDILAIGVHPDDVELGCSGSLLAAISQGKKVGILDLTKGELGTRGTPEGRLQEAQSAAQILGVECRENVGMADGFFKNDEEHQKLLISYIRKFRPDLVLANAIDDRHPDHGRAAQLINDACFYAGLRKVITVSEDGVEQEAWRPKNVFHYIQDRYIKPAFIVDISAFMDKKIEAIRAFKSQFFVPTYNSNEPQSYISTPEFLEFIEARAKELGHAIGVKYGEGFTSYKALGVSGFNFL